MSLSSCYSFSSSLQLLLLLNVGAATATTLEFQGHTSESAVPDIQSYLLRRTGRAAGQAAGRAVCEGGDFEVWVSTELRPLYLRDLLKMLFSRPLEAAGFDTSFAGR